MKRALTVVTMVVGLMAFSAVPAYASEPIDACRHDDPDVHINVVGIIETCFMYPNP